MAEEVQQAKEKILPKFSRSDVMAFAALAVSLAALFVSIYEANIMKDQQVLMQEQQKASTLPFLSQNQLSSFNTGKSKFTYVIENKGLGPALIKSAQLQLNGQSIKDYDHLSEELKKIFPEEAAINLGFMDLQTTFLPANQTLELITIEYNSFNGQYDLISKMIFSYEFCYCSVFDDCWKLDAENAAIQLDQPCGE